MGEQEVPEEAEASPWGASLEVRLEGAGALGGVRVPADWMGAGMGAGGAGGSVRNLGEKALPQPWLCAPSAVTGSAAGRRESALCADLIQTILPALKVSLRFETRSPSYF